MKQNQTKALLMSRIVRKRVIFLTLAVQFCPVVLLLGEVCPKLYVFFYKAVMFQALAQPMTGDRVKHKTYLGTYALLIHRGSNLKANEVSDKTL